MMKQYSTAQRIKQLMDSRQLRQVDILRAAAPYCYKYGIKLNKNDLSQYVSGKVEPGQDKLTILGLALNVSEAWLMGFDVPMERTTDRYSMIFRRRLEEEISCIDPQQFGGDPAPLSDYRRLQQLGEGSTPLSLKDACEAAEALGCSMSYMLQEIDEDFVRDTKKAPGTDSSEPRDAIEFDIISRIQKMDPAQQSLLLATLKIADEQNQKTPVAAPASIDDTKQ